MLVLCCVARVVLLCVVLVGVFVGCVDWCVLLCLVRFGCCVCWWCVVCWCLIVLFVWYVLCGLVCCARCVLGLCVFVLLWCCDCLFLCWRVFGCACLFWLRCRFRCVFSVVGLRL